MAKKTAAKKKVVKEPKVMPAAKAKLSKETKANKVTKPNKSSKISKVTKTVGANKGSTVALGSKLKESVKNIETKSVKIKADKSIVKNQLQSKAEKKIEVSSKKIETPSAVESKKNKLSAETEVLGQENYASKQLAKVERSQLSDEQMRWYDFAKKYGKVKPRDYKMTEQYEANTPILHKILGWGYITSNEFDRLEVVFESGKKMLISNYKSN
jgi:hypothetical protein